MEEWESWQEAGLTLDEWVAHVLSGAADRRELARFQAERGKADAAQLLTRSAVARELYAASLHGGETAEEAQVVSALLPTWDGSSSEELLTVARDVLASPTVNS